MSAILDAEQFVGNVFGHAGQAAGDAWRTFAKNVNEVTKPIQHDPTILDLAPVAGGAKFIEEGGALAGSELAARLAARKAAADAATASLTPVKAFFQGAGRLAESKGARIALGSAGVGAGAYFVGKGVQSGFNGLAAKTNAEATLAAANGAAFDANLKDSAALVAALERAGVKADRIAEIIAATTNPATAPGGGSQPTDTQSFFSGLDNVAKTGIALAFVIGGLVLVANATKKKSGA